MGRSPCCAKEGLNRGAWAAREDKILTNYIKDHGEGKWRDLPQRAGLKRCGKSCRLRWLNYLRPDIKRGNISLEEEELIIKLHKLLGNRWSLIAGRLPGRTDNEIKNYWNTNLSKRIEGQKKTQVSNKKNDKMNENGEIIRNSQTSVQTHRVIRTKAVRCTRVIIPQLLDNKMVKEHFINNPNNNNINYWDHDSSPSSAVLQDEDDSARLLMDFDISDLLISDILSSDFQQGNAVDCGGDHGDNYYKGKNNNNIVSCSNYDHYVPVSAGSDAMIDDNSADETLMLENWRNSESLPRNEALELKTLASLFNSDDEKLLFVVP